MYVVALGRAHQREENQSLLINTRKCLPIHINVLHTYILHTVLRTIIANLISPNGEVTRLAELQSLAASTHGQVMLQANHSHVIGTYSSTYVHVTLPYSFFLIFKLFFNTRFRLPCFLEVLFQLLFACPCKATSGCFLPGPGFLLLLLLVTWMLASYKVDHNVCNR